MAVTTIVSAFRYHKPALLSVTRCIAELDVVIVPHTSFSDHI